MKSFKTICFIISLAAILLSGGCLIQNMDQEFPDFDYNAVYFPLQYPLRTLVLGKDRIDNSLDNELKFHIGVSIGGLYNNKQNRPVSYVVDNNLAANLVNGNGDTIMALPLSYYTLEPANEVIIPAGSFNGLIQVQLNEAFLHDALAIKGNYVIPLRITKADADSVMSGIPVVEGARKTVPSDWESGAQPKDYVLFGIKYINEYHGDWFHRGKDVAYDGQGQIINETVYREKYIVHDQVWKIKTTGRFECITNGVGINSGSNYAMKLAFDSNGGIAISGVPGSVYQVTGTGAFTENGAEWGGEKQDQIILNYQYSDGANNHVVNDTLVFRNKGLVYEDFTVTWVD